MSDRLGRADLHMHTLASDGTSTLEEILGRVEMETDLDVIAITDHERIDAALAGRTLARSRRLRFEVVVGEEVTTTGGHLVALFIEEPVRSLRSLGWTISAIHEQGGLAVPAHPLVPYPLCAQGRTLRRLLANPDRRMHPDGLETFNPTALGRASHGAAVRFAAEHGLAALGSSDAHVSGVIGTCWTTFPGRTAEDLRAAILERRTHAHGEFHGTGGQLSTFGRQLRKYGRDARDGVRGRILRDGTGRDLGYPGGRHRPPRFEEYAGTLADPGGGRATGREPAAGEEAR